MPRISTNRKLAAFLDLIAASEGTSTATHTRDDGYDIIVDGVDGQHAFSDYSAHPFSNGRPPIKVKNAPKLLYSTASGRYQITLHTWQTLTMNSSRGTFSPRDQDVAAVQMLAECHAIDFINASKIACAIKAASETWTRFKADEHSQGGRALDWLLETYTKLLSAN